MKMYNLLLPTWSSESSSGSNVSVCVCVGMREMLAGKTINVFKIFMVNYNRVMKEAKEK